MPQTYIDTSTVPITTGTIRSVAAGGDFQGALNAAQPGDMIVLQAGAVFQGPFTLPNKAGAGWITVRTSTPDGSFPLPGTRVTPAHASLMAKIVGAGSPVIAIQTSPGAHHYRFIGLEIAPQAGLSASDLVLLGTSENTSLAAVPHDLIFDRCYIHGDPAVGSKRGIALNSASTAIIDSHLSDFKRVGQDTQAIAGWNGPGPFKIVNNYLEGAGENVMFGGADPFIQNLVPADIEIRRNHFAKPLTWKSGDPSYAGTPWSVKNLLELKNARRVLIEGNLFEQNWAHAQVGFAFQFTVRNQDGTAPWSVVEDVTFRHNIVRHSGSGINILGRDETFPSGSQQTKRIAIRNNLFADIDYTRWGGPGRLFQLLGGAADVSIEHNTAVHTGSTVIMAEGAPHTGFVYRDNISPHNDYGVFGTGSSVGLASLAQYFPGALFERNVLAGQPTYSTRYSPGNFFPATLAAVGFRDLAGGDYQLAAGSPYRSAATDGKDIGVDFAALAAAFSGPSSPGPGPGPGGGTPALTAAITAPQGGSTVSQVVTVSATASSTASRINLMLNGSIVTVVGGATASHRWDTTTSPNGPHTWTAKAYDASGGSVSSAPASVVVRNTTGGGDTTAPVVAITQPVNRAPVPGTTGISNTVARESKVSITATASDNVGVTRVDFYVNGKLKCSDTTVPNACVWQVPTVRGKTYRIQAKAHDAAGNVGSSGIVTVMAR